MDRVELRKFQRLCLDRKEANECDYEGYLVDRSYVDVAAYWLVRDSFDLPPAEQSEFANRCRELAGRYDLHVYFPMGQIPFVSDGYRSENSDFHQRIASKILDLLKGWELNYITVESPDLEERLTQVTLAATESLLFRRSKTW